MSLFDLDSDASSTSSSSSASDSGGKAEETSSTMSGSASVRDAADVRALLGLPSRYTLTQADVDRAAARRRAEALAAHGRGVAASGSGCGNAAGQSVFGASIAEALRERQRTKEAVLLQKLRQQRAAEASDASLVKIDRNVGVFVTDAYKEVLRRHAMADEATGNATSTTTSSAALSTMRGEDKAGDADTHTTRHDDNNNDDDDDDEPLAAYLRQLDAAASAAAAVTEAHAGRRHDGDVPPDVSVDAAKDELLAPTRTASMTSMTTTTTSAAHDSVAGEAGDGVAPDALPSNTSAVAAATANMTPTLPSSDDDALTAHVEARYRAREARRLRRADAAYMLACAERCNVRIARGVQL